MSSDEKYLDELLKQITSDEEASTIHQETSEVETDLLFDHQSDTMDEMLENSDVIEENQETEEVSIHVDLNEDSVGIEVDSDSMESASPDQELSDLLKILEADSHLDFEENPVAESPESSDLDIESFLDNESFLANEVDDLDNKSLLENDSNEEYETELVSEDLQLSESDDTTSTSFNDDSDIAALFSMGEEDEELAEINELLKKDENHELVEDDEMLMMLSKAAEQNNDFDNKPMESSDDGSSIPLEADEKGKNKKRQKIKKEKKIKQKVTPEQEAGVEGKDKVKKPGLLRKLLDALMEAEEEAEDAPIAASEPVKAKPVSDENKELLDELEQEDLRGKKGKKQGKEKKGKGEKSAPKLKKEKKPKKEKAPKVENKLDKPEKKIPRKKIISVFALAASFLAIILIFALIIPTKLNISKAYEANDKNDFHEVYKLLAGEKLNEEDQKILTKAKIVLEVERKYASYVNHKKLGMELEAINDLFQGIKKYNDLSEYANEYKVSDKITEIYYKIMQALLDDYSISEEEALIINDYDKVLYTKKINSIVYGTEFEDPAQIKSESEQELPDLLPEESIIIEGQVSDNQISDESQTESDTGEQNTEETAQPDKEIFSGTVDSETGSVDFSQSTTQGEPE